MTSNAFMRAIAIAVVSSGCATVTDGPIETADADLNPELVGDSGQLLMPGGSIELSYTGEPRFLAVRTSVGSTEAGVHRVRVEPLDPDGDAALWVTDKRYMNLAIARPTKSRSAVIEQAFPATGGGTNEYWLVIRNESSLPGRFRLSLGYPVNPPNPDPDEGDIIGGTAPADLGGRACEGVVGIWSSFQTFNSQGQVLYAVPPRKGSFSTGVRFVSESVVRIETRTLRAPARDLHVVASSGLPDWNASPTMMAWNVGLDRDGSGSLVGNAVVGDATVRVIVGSSTVQLSFSGQTRQVDASSPSGLVDAKTIEADGKIPLASCVSASE
jgi:hypothetical protein